MFISSQRKSSRSCYIVSLPTDLHRYTALGASHPQNLLITSASSSDNRKKKNFLDDCRIPLGPFDYGVKAGQPAR
jgi:hypothetical protein